MLLGGVLVLMSALIGVGLTTFAGTPLRGEERVAIGVVAGTVAVAVCSFCYFLVAGMGVDTLAFGVAVPGAVAVLGARHHADRLRREARWLVARARLPWRDRRSVRPLLLLTVVAAAVATRVLALAYQATPRGIATGSLAGWGDWAAHLAYAGSFADGDNRALDLPLATGWPLRYHFLANYVGGLFTTTGLSLPRALVITSWMIAVVITPLLWCAVERLTASRLTGALTVLIFVLAGGVGVWYFFVDDVAAHGWRVVKALPQTYARMPDQGLWVDNTISAALYAQRSTLFGLAMGLAALILLLAARPRAARSGFVAAGLLVGITGITFVHMLFSSLALATLAGIADWRRTRTRVWMWFVVPAAVVGLPLAAAINPPTSALRWMLGWMANGSEQPWIVFWLRNVGILLPLFALVGLGTIGRARLRRLSAPLWLWFVVPNLVAFHPSEWNNTKFFLFWQLAAAVAIADVVARLLTAHRRRPAPVSHMPVPRRARLVSGTAGGALLVAALTVTGALDTLRAMQRSSAIEWVEHDDLAAAAWLRANRRAGDVLVYGTSNTSAVAALGAVPAVSGYAGWTIDLGLPDAWDRHLASWAILAGTGTGAGGDGDGTDDGIGSALELVERYGATLVSIGPRERSEAAASDEFWEAHGTLVFERGAYRIYRIGAPTDAENVGAADVDGAAG